MLHHRRGQIVDAFTGRGHGRYHRRPPWPLFPEFDRLGEVPGRFIGPLPVGLVDREDIRHLEQPGLGCLNGVAPPRVDHHHRGVGGIDDLELGLTDTHRLHDHRGEPEGVEQSDHLGRGSRQASNAATVAHRPDEHTAVRGPVLHPDPVTEDGAT